MSTLSVIAERGTDPLAVRILKRTVSFPAMLCCLLAVLAVLTVRSRFDDPDMWWHLKSGEIIWTTHSIPVVDLFSWTTHHHATIPHEWLSQLLIYAAWRFGGYSGLMLWLCFFSSAVLIAGYALCSLWSGNLKVSFLGAMTVWIFSTAGLAVRPQMIGYLLLIAELAVLHLGRTRSPRWFLFLPPLFALWINCHGSFFMGILVVGVFLFASFFDFRTGSLEAPGWTSGRRKMLMLAMVLSVAALFLNPVGARSVLYPVNTLLHQPIGITMVQEWQPLQLSSARGTALCVVLGGSALLVILRRSELFLHELLLLALGAWMAVSHQRMLFPFGILAAPILSRQLATSWEGYNAQQDRRLPNAIFMAVALLLCVLAFPGRRNLAEQVERESPVHAVEFLKAHPLSGPMLNEYVYGGYLIWAAPEYPVFVDGRADVFEWTGVLGDFSNWATLSADPHLLLDKYGVRFCLLDRQSPMVPVMRLLPGWKSVYSDSQAVIFQRTNSSALSAQKTRATLSPGGTS